MDQRPWCPRLLFFPSTKKVSLQYFCQSISLSEITVTLLLGDGWAVWQHFYKVWMGWRTEQGQMRDVGGGGGRKAMLIHAPSNTFQPVKSLTTCFFHDNTLVSACMLKLFSPSTKNWLHNIPEPSQSECEPSQNHSIHPVCVLIISVGMSIVAVAMKAGQFQWDQLVPCVTLCTESVWDAFRDKCYRKK